MDTGDGERTIVCGAPNVAAGQTVAVALPGARMPGGEKLRKAKLRGVASDGMILSEIEIEVGEDADGIMVLDDGPAPGTPLGEVIAVADPVLELEVTPNRVDCLGVHGVAREVHAITAAPLAPDPWEEDAEAGGSGEATDLATVAVEVPALCPRFTARVFTDLEVGSSPPWLKARLAAAGQRPINNVVDITNYVMLLTAQPLHAFDLDRVSGGALTIRAAAEGETMTTLDGVERVLDAETVLVCDADGPSGIAGIMGGQRTEVSASTTRVLLEVATWNGTNILRTSRMLGLRSEASSRFEKQLHPELTLRAQRVASRLLVELCGAKLLPGTIDVAAEPPPPRVIGLRASRVSGLLGMEIPQDDQAAYLRRLGFGVEHSGADLEVSVPADRYFDVTREADLIEEVGRVHGLDEHLPTTLPDTAGLVGGLTREQRLQRRAEDTVRDLGFDEVVGWSFTDPRGALPLADRPRGPARRRHPHRQPALRGAVGDADDPARLSAGLRPRQPRPRRRPSRPVRVRPRVPAGGSRRGRRRVPGGQLPGRAPGTLRRAAAARLPRRRTPRPRLLACARAGSSRLPRAQGRARGAGGRARDRGDRRARRRAFPASRALGPGRLRRRTGRTAGSARCTRSSAGAGT